MNRSTRVGAAGERSHNALDGIDAALDILDRVSWARARRPGGAGTTR